MTGLAFHRTRRNQHSKGNERPVDDRLELVVEDPHPVDHRIADEPWLQGAIVHRIALRKRNGLKKCCSEVATPLLGGYPLGLVCGEAQRECELILKHLACLGRVAGCEAEQVNKQSEWAFVHRQFSSAFLHQRLFDRRKVGRRLQSRRG